MTTMNNDQVFHNVKFDTSNKNKITFTLSRTDVAYANTLVRLIMTGVQMVAFRADMTEKGTTTDVVIHKNTTPMTNEMLADRIGLLPIKVENPGNWDKNKYIFKLDVTNNKSTPLDVTASDIQVFEVDKDGKETFVPNTKFFEPDKVTQQTALLAVLKAKRVGQDPETIKLEAKASIGTGREHARFIPTSQCAYKYTVNSDPVFQKAKFEEWVVNNKKADKEQINGDSDESKQKREVLRREFDTLELDRCYLENDGIPYSFDFQVESIGTYPVTKIVQAGIQAGIRLCDLFSDLNQKKEDADKKLIDRRRINFPRITAAANLVTGFDFTFQKQDHTLGNLLQSYMDLNMMEKEIPGTQTKAILTYVGYFIPHPLRDEMVLRVGVSTNNDSDAREAVSQAAQGCRRLFESWSNEWRSTFGKASATAVVESQDENDDNSQSENNSNQNNNSENENDESNNGESDNDESD